MPSVKEFHFRKRYHASLPDYLKPACDMSLMVASGGLLPAGAAATTAVMLPINVQQQARLMGTPVSSAVVPAAVSANSSAAGGGGGAGPVVVVVSGGGGDSGGGGGGGVKRRESGDSESRSHHSSSNGSHSSDEHTANKIFVGGISFQTTVDKLRGYFAPYGTILDVMVLKDPNTNRNRGFGFVTFADVESVQKVLAQEEHTLDGKKIDPKLATPKGQKSAGAAAAMAGGGLAIGGGGGGGFMLNGYGNGVESNMPRKVFVGGVSQETGVQELLDYFTQFGPVLECNLQMDNNTKRHRGFAFVTFEHEEHSARVVRKHHHVVKNKTVECKYAQPKETIQASERAKRAQLLTMMQTAAVGNPLAAAAAAAAAASPLAAAAHAQQQMQQHYSRVMSAAAAAAAAPVATVGSSAAPAISAGPAFSGLASFRYAPYTVPTMTAAAAAAAAHAHAHAHANSQLSAGATPVTSAGPAVAAPGHQTLAHLAALPAGLSAALHAQVGAAAGHAGPAPAAPAPGHYQLANFDMTGLHGLDWSGAPIYGMYPA